MTARTVLPNRRPHLVLEFEQSGHRYVAGIGFFADDRPAEVFLDCGKVGSAADVNAKDGAILLSLAMQHGVPLDTIGHALKRNSDGSPAGPIGRVVDLLVKEGL